MKLLSSVAVGIGALAQLVTGMYDIAIGDGAGASIIMGSCVILIGENIDVPTPNTSFYINIDGKEYPNSARAEPWLQALARQRAHALVDRMSDAEIRGGEPQYAPKRRELRAGSHHLIDEMSFFVDECRAEKVS